MKHPFLDAVLDYCNQSVLPLHTPGHKQGIGVEADFKAVVQKWGLKLDIDPPLLPNGQNWSLPTDLLTAAREEAAILFGAIETFFLTNGTSSGIQAMFLALGKHGKVVMPRHVHSSVISALIISGCEPLFLAPPRTSHGMPDSRFDPSQLRQVLSTTSNISAIFTQNPSYYGFATDLTQISQIAHDYQVPLLVDEAHGPHFCFSADLPLPALAAGADLVAQSTHKLLTSLTGSSMLHVAKGMDPSGVGRCVDLVQSTSPSFLLLASLEAAVFQLATKGKQLIANTLELAADFRTRTTDIPGIRVLGEKEINSIGYPAFDPTKLVVDFSSLGISGLEAAAILRQDFSIQVEMADFRRILAVLGPGDTRAGIFRLEQALRDIASKYDRRTRLPEPPIMPEPSILAISPRQAFFAESTEASLSEAAGKIAAEIVAPYPPGIPVVIPGEIITQEQIQYLQELSTYGFKIAGARDGVPSQIRVVL